MENKPYSAKFIVIFPSTFYNYSEEKRRLLAFHIISSDKCALLLEEYFLFYPVWKPQSNEEAAVQCCSNSLSSNIYSESYFGCFANKHSDLIDFQRETLSCKFEVNLVANSFKFSITFIEQLLCARKLY